jgi:hypothetical protein
VQFQTECRHEDGLYVVVIIIVFGRKIGGIDPLKYVVFVARGSVLVELYLVNELRELLFCKLHVGAQLRVKGRECLFVFFVVKRVLFLYFGALFWYNLFIFFLDFLF